MRTVGKVILGILVVGGTAASYNAVVKSEVQDVQFEDTLKDVTQIPQARSKNPSNTKTGEQSNLAKHNVDDDETHYLLCYRLAADGVEMASLEKAMSLGGNTMALEELQVSIDKIVIGSLQDWLFQYARRISPPLSAEKSLEPAIKELIHECRLQHYQHAGYPKIRRNSQRMRELEQCYNNKTCLGGTF